MQAEMAPSGAPGSTEFDKEECDGMEDLLRRASALRFGKDLRLLEVRRVSRRCGGARQWEPTED